MSYQMNYAKKDIVGNYGVMEFRPNNYYSIPNNQYPDDPCACDNDTEGKTNRCFFASLSLISVSYIAIECALIPIYSNEIGTLILTGGVGIGLGGTILSYLSMKCKPENQSCSPMTGVCIWTAFFIAQGIATAVMASKLA